MFFVVGTGRSGTNLLRDMLNLHESIYMPQETHWIPKMHEFYGLTANPFSVYQNIIERTRYHDDMLAIERLLEDFEFDKQALYALAAQRLRDENAATLVEVNDAIFGSLAEAKGKVLYGDKTPEYGFYMGMLQQLWPESRFVHMIRDGGDVALSMSKHRGFEEMVNRDVINWCSVAFDYRARRIAWEERVKESARAIIPPVARPVIKKLLGRGDEDSVSLAPYGRLWRARLRRISDEATRLKPGTYCEIRYEELLSEPAQALAVVAKTLEVECSSKWLESAAGIIRPNSARKSNASEIHREMIDTVGDTMSKYGYS